MERKSDSMGTFRYRRTAEFGVEINSTVGHGATGILVRTLHLLITKE